MASRRAESKEAVRQLIFLWAGWRDPAKIDIFCPPQPVHGGPLLLSTRGGGIGPWFLVLGPWFLATIQENYINSESLPCGNISSLGALGGAGYGFEVWFWGAGYGHLEFVNHPPLFAGIWKMVTRTNMDFFKTVGGGGDPFWPSLNIKPIKNVFKMKTFTTWRVDPFERAPNPRRKWSRAHAARNDSS